MNKRGFKVAERARRAVASRSRSTELRLRCEYFRDSNHPKLHELVPCVLSKPAFPGRWDMRSPPRWLLPRRVLFAHLQERRPILTT
jgi:hypothetical protein